MRGGVLALAIVCTPLFSFAKDAEEALRDCFHGAAAEDRAAREACVGTAFDVCEAQPWEGGGSYVIGCMNVATEAWESLLQDEFATLLLYAKPSETVADLVDPTEVDLHLSSIREAQVAWEAYRAAQCRYAALKWPGGDMGRFDAVICLRDLTAARAIALWQEQQPMPWPDEHRWE